MALREYLAGAVIAVMYAGGCAPEELAQSGAQRELSALLRRAPRFVHRLERNTLTTANIDEVRFGDELLVKPGTVVAVDGVVTGAPAIHDEAALTGLSESNPLPGWRTGAKRRGECFR